MVQQEMYADIMEMREIELCGGYAGCAAGGNSQLYLYEWFIGKDLFRTGSGVRIFDMTDFERI